MQRLLFRAAELSAPHEVMEGEESAWGRGAAPCTFVKAADRMRWNWAIRQRVQRVRVCAEEHIQGAGDPIGQTPRILQNDQP